MKKLYFFLVFFVFFGSLVFCDVDEQEELDYLLFLPNRSDLFYDQDQAMNQLDNIAKYLMGRELTSGQIVVYGYAADADIEIDLLELSRERTFFVINELEKRGVSNDFFSEPVGYGPVDLWGSNEDEGSRVPNRRVRILLDGSLITPEVIKAAEPDIPIASYENIEDKPSTPFPWEILLLLIGIPLIILLFFLLSRKFKKNSIKKAAKQPPPAKVVHTAQPPVPAVNKYIVLNEEEIRLHAYKLYEYDGHSRDAQGNWYLSLCALCAKYEADGYTVIWPPGIEWRTGLSFKETGKKI
jgi:hypothetical protein